MSSRVFVGLSGPTFYDYQNVATRAQNDDLSSPNPILENALGLAVFYDEIWFLCESLCPQSLRGHAKVKYLDKYLSGASQSGLRSRVVAALRTTYPNSGKGIDLGKILGQNFADYWAKVGRTGAFWWNDSDRAVDNHSHGLDVLGQTVRANSNSAETLVVDIAVCEAVRDSFDMCVSLNSFSRNIYNALHPNQFDPVVDAGDQAICSTAVISAMVQNCMTKVGPHADVFEKISESDYVAQFRGFMQDKKIEDAYACYKDVVNEIDKAVRDAVFKAANRAHPTKGISHLVVESGLELTGAGLATRFGDWALGSIAPKPISAAAFILDIGS